MKKFFANLFLILLIFSGVQLIAEGGEGQMSYVLTVVFLVLVLLVVNRKNLKKWKSKRKKARRKERNAPAVKTTPQKTTPVYSAPAERRIQPEKPAQEIPVQRKRRKCRKFTIVGVTFNGRQNYLRKIANYEKPFDICFYELQKTEYKGELAFQIVANLDDGSERVLGFISRDDIPEVDAIFDSITGETVDVYGGPDYENEDKNYGASITLYLD